MRHVRGVVVQFPGAKRLHRVMDNRSARHASELCRYLGQLPGVWQARPPLRAGAQRRSLLTDASPQPVVHDTPRPGSRLNQVGIGLGVLCRRLLRRGESRCVEELAQQVRGLIDDCGRHEAPADAGTYTGKPRVSGQARGKRKRFRHRRKMLMNVRSR